MRHALTLLRFALLLLSLSPVNAYAETKKDGNVPQAIEDALTKLLKASDPGAPLPPTEAINAVLQFALSDALALKSVELATRDYGKGVFYKNTIQAPLATLMRYMLNPNIPGETIYPTCIRKNAWTPESEILKKSAAFLKSPLPPQNTLFSKGVELEEITPDVSSGCYYHYYLNRLFILHKFKGNAVLLSIAFMPNPSSIGLRGIVVGEDNQWTYVYTPTVGTNLNMLSWAKTYMYGSATVSIYTQKPNSNSSDFYTFKWTKAGWSGMNVVTHKHIEEGISRFMAGFKQVMESPNRPSPEAIVKKHQELKKLDLPELQKDLEPFAAYIMTFAAKKKSDLSNKVFLAVLKDGAYPKTFTKENAIAELMKLYIKNEIMQKK